MRAVPQTELCIIQGSNRFLVQSLEFRVAVVRVLEVIIITSSVRTLDYLEVALYNIHYSMYEYCSIQYIHNTAVYIRDVTVYTRNSSISCIVYRVYTYIHENL